MALLETAARAESGLTVHDTAAGLVTVLSARFPVTRRLAGSESFDAAMRAFVAAEPLGSLALSNYGAAFPQFLRRFGRDACVDYVADIAELEAARTRAYHAAEAAPMPAGSFAAVTGDLRADLRLSFHPSVVLVQSRFPIVSVWQANQRGHDMKLRQWGAEAALVARPFRDVSIWRLPPGGFEFLTELSRGSTIAQSAAAAAGETPGFDLAFHLSMLREVNIVIACW